MPIQSSLNGTISGYSDDYWDGTVEVNFAPKPATAHVALQTTIGDGRSALGIRSYDYRETPGGPNKKKDFTKYYWNWPPVAYHSLMTRVTFGIDIYENHCYGWWGVDFWS
jgi:hypothetical protein